MTFGWPHALILLVALSRLIEAIYAERKAKALFARGAMESGRGHYPLFVVLHAAWLLAMFVLTAPDPSPNLPLLTVFAALQPLRIWTFATLGDFATTRVLTLTGTPRIASGPYRFVRHPSYLIAAVEVVVLPLALGLQVVAVVFGVLNVALILWRIRVENAAWERAAYAR
jgi:methyltransferase